jgi:hypothetical protein
MRGRRDPSLERGLLDLVQAVRDELLDEPPEADTPIPYSPVAEEGERVRDLEELTRERDIARRERDAADRECDRLAGELLAAQNERYECRSIANQQRVEVRDACARNLELSRLAARLRAERDAYKEELARRPVRAS